MKKTYLTVALIVLIVLLLLGLNFYKCDIHSATIKDLTELEDIGIVLATRIELYLDSNPNSCVDDLINVEGIGEKRLKQIKKEFD